MIPIPGFEEYLISETGEVFSTKSNRALTPHLNENGYLYITMRKNNRNKTVAIHRLVAQAYIPNTENKPFVNHINADRSNPHKENLEWCTQSENLKHAYKLGNHSQKKNFTSEELDWLLDRLINHNQTMTALSKELSVGLSRLTINMRNRAHKTNLVSAFEEILKKQKTIRNTEANSSKRKPVLQLDSEGSVVRAFPSATAAARALDKVSSGPIHNALNPTNPQKKAYGYSWKYA